MAWPLAQASPGLAFPSGQQTGQLSEGRSPAASCVTRGAVLPAGGAGGPSPPALTLAAGAEKRVPGERRLSYGSPSPETGSS